MRIFIGIEIPENLREKLSQIQNKIKSLDLDIKLVEKENFHINLKFLGEVPDNKIESIKDSLKAIDFHEFDIVVNGLGVFPSMNYVRILWAGISNPEDITNLAEIIDNCLSKLGFQKEKRSFSPHITLGRIRSPKSKEKLIEFVEKNKNIEIGKFTVKKIFIFKSTLTKKGPIYEKIFELDLKTSLSS